MFELKNIKNSKVLISALDWGFGHTARTAVLIKRLISQGNLICFAGNKKQINFISSEFPSIKTELIDGYNITLNSAKSTYIQLFIQLLKINKAIKAEKAWLAKRIKAENYDLVISDNRYGFYHKEVPCIFLTHQTELQIPFGKRIVNAFLKQKIDKFSACWVPDYKDQSLSGNLSNGSLSISKIFIGPLSRFSIAKKKETYAYQYLFLISGPKPECDHFYNSVHKFILENNLNAAIAVPFELKKDAKNQKVDIYEQPSSTKLESLINDSRIIVSKSGYTTIMDLIPAQKKAILLPTKRQFEQIYLSSLHCTPISGTSKGGLDFSKLL